MSSLPNIPLIEFIEKKPGGDDPLNQNHTVGIKWWLGDGSYGLWKITSTREEDFHYLASGMYWWSMGRKYWLVRIFQKLVAKVKNAKTSK